MTEVTEEARAELDVMDKAVFAATGWRLDADYRMPIMLALDKHHGRTPPDPMVAKAGQLQRYLLVDGSFDGLVSALKRIFPDG